MKKILLTDQKRIAKFFKEIGVDYDNGFKHYCGNDLFVHSAKNMGKVKEYKVKEDDRVVEGYATTPNVDWVKDSVTMEAIKDAAKHLLRKGTNTVFFNHDTGMPVGRVVNTLVDKTGLFITAIISKAKDVDDIWTKVKEGIIGSFSIRFITKAVEVIKDTTGNVVQWNIKKIEILEVSLAPLPMNSAASITNVVGKSMKDLGKGNSNNKNGSKVMKKSDTKSGAITEMVKELVKELFDESRKSMVEEIKGLLPKTKAEAKAEQEAADAKAKADADKAKGDAEKAKDDKIAALEKENKELKEKGTPKGVQGEAGKEDTGKEVKKALKDIEDEGTCVFVLKAMEDESVYSGLSEPEKDKCKQLYFQMLKSEKKI